MAVENRMLELHVLVLKESNGWTAQCLQYDVAAQGDTVREAIEAFTRVFETQLQLDAQEGKAPLEGIGRAPDVYWEQFRQGSALRERHIPLRPPASFPSIPGRAAEPAD